MRKLLMAAMAATMLVPVAASAQSAREVRHDNRDIRHDRQEVRRDMRHGDYREARHDRRELRRDRQERREDWRDYREAHRDVYRRGAYNGPRGYRYRNVTVGYRFAPAYYGSRYWINDPMTYRLPRPGYNQRWIRYGNDVVLINVRTGRAIRIYNNFFW